MVPSDLASIQAAATAQQALPWPNAEKSIWPGPDRTSGHSWGPCRPQRDRDSSRLTTGEDRLGPSWPPGHAWWRNCWLGVSSQDASEPCGHCRACHSPRGPGKICTLWSSEA